MSETRSAPAQPMIARKSGLIFLNTILGGLLGLVAAKVAALYLGREYVGQFEAALGLVGILYFFTDLGFGTAHVKRVSEGWDEADCFATFAAFKIVVTTAFCAVIAGGIGLWVYVLHKPFTDFTLPTIALATLYYTFMSLRGAPQSTFDARRETARGQLTVLVDTLVRVALTIVVAIVFAAAVRGAGPLVGRIPLTAGIVQWIAANPGAAYGAATAAGTILSTILALAYFLKDGKVGRFRMEILRSYMTFALPTFLIGSFATVAARIDVVALTYFGSASDAGLFAFPRRLTAVIEGIPIAVTTLLFPTYSALSVLNDRAELAALTNRAMRWISLVCAPIVAATVVLAGPLIHIVFSDDWLPATSALAVLAIYTYFVALTRPYNALLAGTNRPGEAAKIAIFVYLLNIVLNLVLIPRDIKSIGLRLAGLGVLGAALASAASGLLGYVLFRLAAKRAIGIDETLAIPRHVIAAFVMGLALWAFETHVLPFNRVYDLAVFGVVGGVVYLGALAILREFTFDDVRFLNNALHPGETLAYLRGELFGRR
ncbi:MAG: oligosaccharide flippase family protein [Thermoplasmatota archaeon]